MIINLILVIFTTITTFLLLEIQYNSLKNWEKEVITYTTLLLMEPFCSKVSIAATLLDMPTLVLNPNKKQCYFSDCENERKRKEKFND